MITNFKKLILLGVLIFTSTAVFATKDATQLMKDVVQLVKLAALQKEYESLGGRKNDNLDVLQKELNRKDDDIKNIKKNKEDMQNKFDRDKRIGRSSYDWMNNTYPGELLKLENERKNIVTKIEIAKKIDALKKK